MAGAEGPAGRRLTRELGGRSPPVRGAGPSCRLGPVPDCSETGRRGRLRRPAGSCPCRCSGSLARRQLAGAVPASRQPALHRENPEAAGRPEDRGRPGRYPSLWPGQPGYGQVRPKTRSPRITGRLPRLQQNGRECDLSSPPAASITAAGYRLTCPQPPVCCWSRRTARSRSTPTAALTNRSTG